MIVLSLALLPATGPANSNVANLAVTSTTTKSHIFKAYISGDSPKNVPVGSDVYLTCETLGGTPFYYFSWEVNGKSRSEEVETIKVTSDKPAILAVDCAVTDGASRHTLSEMYIQTFSGERDGLSLLFLRVLVQIWATETMKRCLYSRFHFLRKLQNRFDFKKKNFERVEKKSRLLRLFP